MTEDVHLKALRLISTEQVEGLSAEERRWLHGHLAGCPDCSRHAEALQQSLHCLRSVSVRLDPAVVQRTRLKVLARAAELEGRRARFQPLWAALLLSVLWVFVTTPYLWRGFRWFGENYGLADGVWQAGFLVWWFLPATITAIILALGSRRNSEVEA
jgi:anti-sigma factor RsiW